MPRGKFSIYFFCLGDLEVCLSELSRQKKNTVPSGKLTCPLENWWFEDDPFLFKWSPFFRGHVKFRGCQICFNQPQNHSHESQPLDFWNFASGERGERFPGRNENFDNPRVTVTEEEMEICHLVSEKKITMLLGEWHCYIWVVRISIRKKNSKKLLECKLGFLSWGFLSESWLENCIRDGHRVPGSSCEHVDFCSSFGHKSIPLNKLVYKLVAWVGPGPQVTIPFIRESQECKPPGPKPPINHYLNHGCSKKKQMLEFAKIAKSTRRQLKFLVVGTWVCKPKLQAESCGKIPLQILGEHCMKAGRVWRSSKFWKTKKLVFPPQKKNTRQSKTKRWLPHESDSNKHFQQKNNPQFYHQKSSPNCWKILPPITTGIYHPKNPNKPPIKAPKSGRLHEGTSFPGRCFELVGRIFFVGRNLGRHERREVPWMCSMGATGEP